MKKLLFTMSVLLCAFLLSCSSDYDSHVISYKEQNNEKQHAKELLRRINEENPCSALGVMHNLVLTEFESLSKDKTRGDKDFEIYVSEIRDEAINNYRNHINHNLEPHISLNDFINYYDSIVISAYEGMEIDLGIKTWDPYYVQLNSCLIDMDSVVYDNDTNLLSLLSRIDTIQTRLNAIPESDEQKMLLASASVASNSMDYWVEYVTDMVGPGYQLPDEWKNAVKADYRAGKYTSKIARFTGFWGWIGAAIITGAASYIAYHF